MQYFVNGQMLEYTAEGERSYGGDKTLLSDAYDLTANTPWARDGYAILSLFTDDELLEFQAATRQLLIDCWLRAGLDIPNDFSLARYHTRVTGFDQHLKAVEQTKLLSTERFPLGITRIENIVSSICGVKVRARNPYDDQTIFHFRVIRPQSRDNNPLHRDVWLEDYESCINLYIPVAGSDENSSLILIPGSHHWAESRIERTKAGALINGVRFNVPAVTNIKGDYAIVRPAPKENEMLIFSPYLIHGGAINLNVDRTRISIELRLWKA